MSDTKYNLLFAVEILHKYFNNGVCNDFIITPSALTANVLNGHKIIAKSFGNKIYAGVQLDTAGKPVPTPEEGMQLTFFLELKNPLFFNYTNLPVKWPSGKLYYFTNRNSNVSNGKKFLSKKLPDYDINKTYIPGDLSVNASGTVFQASQTSTGVAPPPNNTVSDFWIQTDSLDKQDHYMSENDSLQWLPSISVYRFETDQLLADIIVSGYNAVTRDYTEIVLSKSIRFSTAVPGFSLDLTHLQAGKYKLGVNGKEQFIYINDELTRKKIFAVVDIFNESTLANENKIMNGGSLFDPSPVFSVNFLNRSTIWRYVLPAGVSGQIKDAGGVYKFPTADAASMYSLTPIPLNDKRPDFNLLVGDNSTPVACPSPDRLTNYVVGVDKYYCSEIFLNY